MSGKKNITYTDLLNNPYYRSRDIDSLEVLKLLRQAASIPQQLLPFKGCLHVIDYSQGRHVALSGPAKNIMGYESQDVLDNGLDFIIDIFHKDDFKIYNEVIFRQTVDFLSKTPQDQHKNYLFSFNYRLKNAEGKWLHLFQQGSYITDSKTKLPLFGIGMVTDITPLRKNSSMIFSIDKKVNEPSVSNYGNILTNHYYPEPEVSRLSRREREIICWLAEGLSSKQVADKLFISESTVVNHRKNILRKTNSKNVAELIRYSLNQGII